MILPDLVKFSDYGGNWEKYEEALYGFFKQDFIDHRVYYKKIK